MRLHLAQPKGDIVADRHRVKERAALKHIGKLFLHFRKLILGHPRDVLMVDHNVSRVGLEKAKHELKRHAFPRAGSSNNGQRLPIADVQRAAAQNAVRSEGFKNVVELDHPIPNDTRIADKK